MIKYIKLAWRNMWRNWRRTAIALVAIVLGLILLLFLDGMIKGSDQAIFGNAVRLYGGNIQVHAPGFRREGQPAAAAAPGRRRRRGARRPTLSRRWSPRPSASTPAASSAAAKAPIRSSSPASSRTVEAPRQHPGREHRRGPLSAGRATATPSSSGEAWPTCWTWPSATGVTLLGRSKHETDAPAHHDRRRHLRPGHGGSGERHWSSSPCPRRRRLYNLRDQVTEVTIIAAEGRARKRGDARLCRPRCPATRSTPGRRSGRRSARPWTPRTAFTSFIGLIVLLIASIGILNLMMMAVFERTREMGVLAALGMKGRQIMGLFLLEGALIGVVGAVIGCLLGVGICCGRGAGGRHRLFLRRPAWARSRP